MTVQQPIGKPHPDAESRLKRAEAVVRAVRAAVVAQSWATLPDKLEANLSEEELMLLAGACLVRMDRQNADDLVLALNEKWKPETPVGTKWMVEAREWASLQSVQLLKAYCMAAFEQLPRTDKAKFLKFANGGRK